MTAHPIDRDELLAWCRNRPTDDGMTTMYDHELRYIVDALDQAEAGVKGVRALHTGTRWPGVTDKPICDACDQPWPCLTIRALDGGA